jgi:hypothetical protein
MSQSAHDIAPSGTGIRDACRAAVRSERQRVESPARGRRRTGPAHRGAMHGSRPLAWASSCSWWRRAGSACRHVNFRLSLSSARRSGDGPVALFRRNRPPAGRDRAAAGIHRARARRALHAGSAPGGRLAAHLDRHRAILPESRGASARPADHRRSRGQCEPLVAAAVASAWLGQALRPIQMVGGGVVLAGVALAQQAATSGSHVTDVPATPRPEELRSSR